MDSSITSSQQLGRDGLTASQMESSENLTIKSAARHTFGLFLLLIVVFLWTASNFLGSSIFADASYAKPFFLTYLNTSVFVLMALPRLVKATYRRYQAGTLRSTARAALSGSTLRSVVQESKSSSLSLGSSMYTEREEFLDQDDHRVSSSYILSESLVREGHLDIVPTARLAVAFCALWFGANYFIMACLQYTTVASATILSSTSSVWTLLIGAVTRIEQFTWRKFCAVLACLLGVILVSSLDMNSDSTDQQLPGLSKQPFSPSTIASQALSEFPDKSPSELLLGDAFALLSAVIYGLYAITLKKSTMVAAPRSIHMPTFFGLIGVFNIIFLFPLFPILHYTNIEPFAWPPTLHIWTVLLVNSIASLLSDVCWAYATVYTSPLVVTVGLSLTIPLSLVGEVILQGRCEGGMYWLGAMVVVGSFVFVQREEVKEDQEEEERQQEILSASMLTSRSRGRADDEEAGLGGGSKQPVVQIDGLDEFESGFDGEDRGSESGENRLDSKTTYGTMHVDRHHKA